MIIIITIIHVLSSYTHKSNRRVKSLIFKNDIKK